MVAVDSTADVDAPALTVMPEPLASSVTVTEWRPGHMRLRIDPPAAQDAFVVVSENWYFDWRATVDGAPVTTVPGNGALITVPVEAGARQIELNFESDAYRTGKAIMLVSVVLVAAGFVGPAAARRKRRA